MIIGTKPVASTLHKSRPARDFINAYSDPFVSKHWHRECNFHSIICYSK